MATATASLTRSIIALLRDVQDAATPQTCVVCGEWVASGDEPACQSCQAELTEITRASYCPRCGRTMLPDRHPRRPLCQLPIRAASGTWRAWSAWGHTSRRCES